MTRTAAGDFAISKIDRLHRDSPAVGQMLLPGSASDSQFRKMYRNGVLLRVSWPAPTELAGKSVPFVFLTDYDRMPQDIGGEGPPFDLAAKRTTTYRRNGMAVAESTPSFPVTDPRWQPNADRPHEAPPCQGIIGLYNRGDRRRWLWKCVSCKLPFEPDFSLLKYPASTDFMEAAEAAYMGCPHCGQIYEHGEKNDMNLDYARWIIEGQKWLEDGSVVGKARRSDMASFWIKGPAARFLEWKTLVFEYLTAMDEFTRTGNEKPLQTTVNTQQALPYIPKSLESLRVPEDLKTRATDLGERVVPPTVRFLVATVDIQKHRFVAQVHGLSEGGDITIVDRFDIRYSKRPETEGGKGFSWVKPGAHPEDWNLLIEGVLLKTYPLADNSGRHMQIKMTLCDSGGQTGVTANAYSFYKRLRSPPEANDQIPETLMPDMPPGLHNRFLLVAGRPTESAPRLRITWPDSGRKDRNAGARGEVPLGILNSDRLKDQLDKRLDRTTPRGGRINFPLWLDHNFYAELCVEIRDDKGKWGNPNNYRNESFDLLTYCLAACIHDSIKMERPDFWGDPPSWATEWDANDLVFNPVTDPDRMGGVKKESFDFSKLGEDLA
jgi:phage terminase large subunit GpA-like protein